MPQIVIDNVSKRFGNNVLFSNASLSIEKGSVVGIVGANGIGKSVLFKMISGIYHVDEGHILIRGKEIGKDFDFPPDMAIFIDSPGFVKLFSGFKNLKMLSDIRGIISEDDIKDAMKLVGLDPTNSTPVKNYSLGMKQKLGIAQAIMEDQDILLFDEPFNALDSESHQQMRKLVRELKQKEKTILLTSHNNSDILELCDDIYKIEDQRIEPCSRSLLS